MCIRYAFTHSLSKLPCSEYLYCFSPCRFVLFSDAYDVVVLGSASAIVKAFNTEFPSGTKIVFGAEHFCWPNANIKDKYPEVQELYTSLCICIVL